MAHLLDRPIWNALDSGWTAWAQGDAQARRINPLYGPFGASADSGEASLAALALLTPPDGELWLAEADTPVPPPGATVVRTAKLAQMLAPALHPTDRAPPDWSTLTEKDAGQMRTLALLTKPGPFHPLTHRLGRFIGIKEEGTLVAMAGERMRVPGFAEVSGVCTHPDHRGRGHAGALMRILAKAMLDRGETPFLHAYASNSSAIALYETLGFKVRAEINMMVITR